MNIDEFWQLIDKTRVESGNDPFQQASLLEDVLYTIPDQEIIDYQNFLDQLQNQAFRRPLWNAAYILLEGCGEDAFMDFRVWILGQGREFHKKIVQNPETLADMVSVEKRLQTTAEPLLYVAERAYEKKTGDFIEDDKLIHERLFDLDLLDKRGCIYTTDKEFEACLKEHYPKLWAKFGW
jgi:hypothetical protein